MAVLVDWAERARRFEEVREKDRLDEEVFIAKLSEQNQQAEKAVTERLRTMVEIWQVEMERLVTSEKDTDWLKFITNEFREAIGRGLASFQCWNAKIHLADSSTARKDVEKSFTDTAKKFVTGVNSRDRLAALIAEREATLTRQRIDLLSRRETLISDSLRIHSESMIPVKAMFTRLFERAIQ